jgi:acetyl-CoA acetyltransferase
MPSILASKCADLITGFAGRIYKKYDGSAMELLGETVRDCLALAGLELREIDGLVTTYLPGVFDGKAHLHFFTNQLRQYLGLRARFVECLDFGGASALAMVYRATKAVESGEAENVLCVLGGKGSDVRSRGVTVDALDQVDPGVSLTPFDRYLRVYEDMNPVSDYALVAQRHSKLFGTTDIQRATLAARMRENARGNERALYRDVLTPEDVLSSPLISDPLHMLESVYPVDGFHAFTVSKKGSSLRSVEVLAYGEAHWHQLPPELPDIVTTPAVESSRNASYPLSKVDCFQLYDSFTITVMLQLEDIGMVPKGASGRYVEETDLAPSGDMPLNTGGGSLNVGQPAYMSGGVILEEALAQLNGMASGHQVQDARVVFINAIGGWNRSHSTTLVLGEKA